MTSVIVSHHCNPVLLPAAVWSAEHLTPCNTRTNPALSQAHTNACQFVMLSFHLSEAEHTVLAKPYTTSHWQIFGHNTILPVTGGHRQARRSAPRSTGRRSLRCVMCWWGIQMKPRALGWQFREKKRSLNPHGGRFPHERKLSRVRQENDRFRTWTTNTANTSLLFV